MYPVDQCQYRYLSSIFIGILNVFITMGIFYYFIYKWMNRVLHFIILFICCIFWATMLCYYLRKDNPVYWLLNHLNNSVNIYLCLYWILGLTIFFALMYRYDHIIKNQKKTFVRKYFHFLCVSLFLPALSIEVEFTRFCFAAILILFFLSEYLKFFMLPLGNSIAYFMNKYTEGKDEGSIVLTHAYLLLGCSLPSFLLLGHKEDVFLISSGAIILGIGDSMASIFGSRYGLHKWRVGKPKSIEGTLSAFAFLIPILVIYSNFNLCTVISTLLTVLYEGMSYQIDNLTIPLLYISLLKSTE